MPTRPFASDALPIVQAPRLNRHTCTYTLLYMLHVWIYERPPDPNSFLTSATWHCCNGSAEPPGSTAAT